MEKVTTAKNQQEYSKLLKEYAQQKEQYQKTENLTAQINHAVQKGDYQGVAQTAKNYMQQNSGIQQGSISTTQPTVNQNGSREHYNNKLNELINNALGIQPASAEEVPYKSQFATSPDGGPMIKTGLSYDNGTSIPKTVPTKIEAMAGTGETLSSGAEISEFIERLGKDVKINQKLLKKALYDYKSSVGRNLQNKYQNELYINIEKITKECVGGIKAAKLAGKIAAKVAPVLTYTYILEQAAEGYQKGGLSEGFKKGLNAAIESAIPSLVFNVMVDTFGISIISSASLILLGSLIIKFVLSLQH